MTNADNIQWKRTSAEGAAIVVSILLAFGIEAWWSDRQDRIEEVVILNSLLLEFESKKDGLEYIRRLNVNIRSSANKLIEFSLSPDSIPKNKTVVDLLNQLWWWNVESKWDSPVLDAVISSDGGSFISNPNLRATLIVWPGRYDYVKSMVRLDQELYLNHLWPYLIEHGSLVHMVIEAEDAVDPSSGEVQYTSDYNYDLHEPFDYTDLLAQREFRNLLVEKIVRHDDILGLALVGLDERLDSTIQAIRDELSR